MSEQTLHRIETAPGVTLSVVVAGAGPLVILMHGWPELGLSWRHQMTALAQAGYTVAAPDMRGYGLSSRPADPAAYDLDSIADDMAALAHALGAKRWVAVGHDWGAPAAWRCALRFPGAVRGVFGLSVPHSAASPMPAAQSFALGYPDRFYYVRYFQTIGRAEAELERDPRAALKRMFFSLSGDAAKDAWVAHRPIEDPLLPGLPDPPAGPLSFMTDAELDIYAERYAQAGFFGSLSWYRNLDRNADQARAYGDQQIKQPAGFLCGDKEIVLTMAPGALERQRAACADLRQETIIPGAGHWIQQECPDAVNSALLGFLAGLPD
jgi:pimeloyl-ACP methyl ester carboxylesterase